MPQFETYAASVQAHSAPLARGLWCWPALVAGAALLLDAFWPLLPDTNVHAVLWIDLAALGCLVWTFTGPRRAKREDWGTPVDGRILSGFVLSVLHVVHLAGADEPVLWLHQIAAAGVCFYTLSAKLRRDARAPDAVWPAFALIVLVLSGYALLSATAGLASLAAGSRRVDVRWASHYGLAKTLLVATILCAGRACESSARALWRVTALIGALVCGLLLFVGGVGLALSSLASLDEPFYFGMSIVVFLLLACMTRMAWDLARERPEEAGRWRASALMFPLVAALVLFGGTTGGEGVRLIVTLAGAAVTAARVAPRVTLAQPAPVAAMLQPAVRAA